MHLAHIRMSEPTYFQIDDDKTSQSSMKEDEINAKPGIVRTQPPLPSKKREIITKFVQEISRVLDQCLFKRKDAASAGLSDSRNGVARMFLSG